MGFVGERKGFFEARDSRTNMRVYWCFRHGGDAEHRQQLSSCCRLRVRKPCADADRALAETKLNALRDLADLRGRRSAIGAVAHRHPGAGIVHHGHPDFDMADADAIVDSLTPTSLAVPGKDVGRSELELERR